MELFYSLKNYDRADLLTCGSCFAEFLLSDIVVFIQHKISQSCKLNEKGKKFFLMGIEFILIPLFLNKQAANEQVKPDDCTVVRFGKVRYSLVRSGQGDRLHIAL